MVRCFFFQNSFGDIWGPLVRFVEVVCAAPERLCYSGGASRCNHGDGNTCSRDYDIEHREGQPWERQSMMSSGVDLDHDATFKDRTQDELRKEFEADRSDEIFCSVSLKCIQVLHHDRELFSVAPTRGLHQDDIKDSAATHNVPAHAIHSAELPLSRESLRDDIYESVSHTSSIQFQSSAHAGEGLELRLNGPSTVRVGTWIRASLYT